MMAATWWAFVSRGNGNQYTISEINGAKIQAIGFGLKNIILLNFQMARNGWTRLLVNLSFEFITFY